MTAAGPNDDGATPNDDLPSGAPRRPVRGLDDETLAAYALDALDPDELASIEARLAIDPSAAQRAATMREVVGRLHPLEPVDDLPVSSTVLANALSRRAGGRSLLSPPSAPAVGAIHREIATDAERFVATLIGADLARPTRLGATVGQLVAHLIGQLERTATELGQGTFPTVDDESYEHWTATTPYIATHAASDGATLAAALADVNRRIIAAVAALDSSDAFGDPRTIGSPASRVLGKSFELWMHIDDVRLALDQRPSVPTAGVVLAICNLATDVMPYGMGATGNAQAGRTMRVVLTGPGGGTWMCALAPGEPPAAQSDATLVADAVMFCRLFHRQVAPERVVVAVDGDRALVDAALVGAQYFAENT